MAAGGSLLKKPSIVVAGWRRYPAIEHHEVGGLGFGTSRISSDEISGILSTGIAWYRLGRYCRRPSIF